MTTTTKSIGVTVYGCERDEELLFRTLSPQFGVTPTIVNAPVSERSAALSRGNRCVSVGHKSEVSASVISALGNAGVKYITTRSVGYNHIDTTAARKMGISIGNAAYSPDSVADYTVMLMLMAIRNAKRTVCLAEEHDYRLPNIRGKELRDMTVGVIGTGRIGEAVIKRLRGFGCRLLTYDRSLKTTADVFSVPLSELLRDSDVITLHVPLNADTYRFIGGEEIGMMKRGAFIINTGRGALIDTGALTDALDGGELGGAALDVLEGEEGIFYFDCKGKPIDHQFLSRLQHNPNVIITPHSAYYTERALHDTVEITIKNCLNFENTYGKGELLYG